VNRRLRAFLEQQGATAHIHTHRPLYTAQEVAAAEDISGDSMAKVVMAVADGRMVMLVLPASLRVDVARVRDELGVHEVRLASEAEFRRLFPDCELGAMPPFGHLYGLPVYVDPELASAPVMLFEAGSHREVGVMPFAEFQRLEHPHVLPLAS
jgi:Ala-tRNA(Pro) deacylase